MSEFEERTVGGLTLRIDRLICVGFGDCIEVSPDSFELDDEGIAVFRNGVDGVDQAELIEACRSCPVDAVTIHDPDGTQIAP